MTTSDSEVTLNDLMFKIQRASSRVEHHIEMAEAILRGYVRAPAVETPSIVDKPKKVVTKKADTRVGASKVPSPSRGRRSRAGKDVES